MPPGDLAQSGTWLRTESGNRESVGVHPPGAEGAFEIETLDGAESFALRKIEGIAVLPDRTQVMAGSDLKFKLTFDPIPKTLRRFSVGEGDYDPATGESAWYFKTVELN